MKMVGIAKQIKKETKGITEAKFIKEEKEK